MDECWKVALSMELDIFTATTLICREWNQEILQTHMVLNFQPQHRATRQCVILALFLILKGPKFTKLISWCFTWHKTTLNLSEKCTKVSGNTNQRSHHVWRRVSDLKARFFYIHAMFSEQELQWWLNETRVAWKTFALSLWKKRHVLLQMTNYTKKEMQCVCISRYYLWIQRVPVLSCYATIWSSTQDIIQHS